LISDELSVRLGLQIEEFGVVATKMNFAGAIYHAGSMCAASPQTASPKSRKTHSMAGKFDNYLTYITSDFREERSLEQPVKPF
jgi:hypothetical protein